MEPHKRIAVETTIDHAKWLVWHKKGRQSVFRIKALDATLWANKGYEHSTLYWNLRRLYFYHREQRRYARELWRAPSQGATDQQQHC
jgi:hypothetical protein